jgi:hypothetical protein
MQINRPAIAAAGLAAIIGLGGCAQQSDDATTGAGSTGAATTTTAPAEPSAELGTAATKLAGTTARIKLTTEGVTASGISDTPHHKMQLSMDMGSSGTMEMRQVGNDLYVELDKSLAGAMGTGAGKWMHIDISKVSKNSALNPENNDPSNAGKLLAASTQVEKTGDHQFKGTIDLTKSPTANAAQLKVLGDKAKAVPFTAATDDQGRLTKLTVDMKAIAPTAGELTTEYSDFGVAVSVEAPAASSIVEMPDVFRKAMGA